MSAQPYIGEIRLFAGPRVPTNWLPCDGRELPISGNEPLFQLLGTLYGGDGQSTFAIPDLRGRAPLHQGARSGGPYYTLADAGGSETVKLTPMHLPAHRHALAARDAAGTVNSPTGAVLARAESSQPGMVMYGSDSVAPMHPAAIDPAGEGAAHDNMQPYLAATYIISPFGIYPVPD